MHVSSNQRARIRAAAAVSALLAGSLYVRPIQAADNTWVGPSSGNWNVAGNWSGGVPQPVDSVFIDGAQPSNSTVSLDITTTIDQLSISAGDTLNVGTNTLTVGGSSTGNSGTVAVSSGGNLYFAGTLNSSARVRMEGFFWLNPGSVTLTGAGVFTLSGAAQIRGSGRLINQNNLIDGEGLIAPFAPGILNYGTIRTTVTNSGMQLYSSVATPLANAGTIEAGAFASFLILSGQAGGKVFDNTAGVIQGQNGTQVQLDGGATIVGGVIRTFGGVFLGGGAIQDLRNEADFRVSGSTSAFGTIQNVSQFSIQSSGAPAYLTMGSATTTFTGAGRINMYRDAHINGAGVFDNQGNTITGRFVSGSGTVSAGTIGDNSLTILNRSNGVIETIAAALAVDPGAGGLANAGTLRATSGGTLLLSNNGAGTFTNSGTVLANGAGSVARVASPSTLTNYSAGVLTGGNWAATAGGRIDLVAATIAKNLASVRIDGPTSQIPALDSLTDNSGALAITSGRDYSFGSALTNNGNLTVGVGSDVFAPTFTHAGAGMLAIVLGGTGAESFGQLSANSIQLDGALSIEWAGSYVPLGISTFTILTGGSITGTFSSLSTPPLSEGVTCELQYFPGEVILRVVPEPGGLALGALLASVLLRRRRIQT